MRLTEKWSMSAEGQFIRDLDHGGHSTQAIGGAYLAWQPNGRVQLDFGAQAGLNHATPDLELYFGLSRKF